MCFILTLPVASTVYVDTIWRPSPTFRLVHVMVTTKFHIRDLYRKYGSKDYINISAEIFHVIQCFCDINAPF